MDVVYAQASAHVAGPDEGMLIYVHFGSHWSASDPVVRKTPDLFSDDPKFGLCMSVPLEEQERQDTGRVPAGSGGRGRRPA